MWRLEVSSFTQAWKSSLRQSRKQQCENGSPYSNRIQRMPRPERLRCRSPSSGYGFWRRWKKQRSLPYSLRRAAQGRTGPPALRQALDRIMARHEALRTRFVIVEGEPRQRITPAEHSRFQCWNRSAPARRAGARGRVEYIDSTGRGGPVRSGEGAVDPWAADPFGRRRACVAGHHAPHCSDGWSMGVLAGELKALYGAF